MKKFKVLILASCGLLSIGSIASSLLSTSCNEKNEFKVNGFKSEIPIVYPGQKWTKTDTSKKCSFTKNGVDISNEVSWITDVHELNEFISINSNGLLEIDTKNKLKKGQYSFKIIAIYKKSNTLMIQ